MSDNYRAPRLLFKTLLLFDVVRSGRDHLLFIWVEGCVFEAPGSEAELVELFIVVLVVLLYVVHPMLVVLLVLIEVVLLIVLVVIVTCACRVETL